MFIHKIVISYKKSAKKGITHIKIFGSFCPVSRLVQSTQNPRVQTGRLIGRPSSGEQGWVDSSKSCINSSSIFRWTIPPRVRTGRLTSRLNSGKSYLSRLTYSSRRLIPYFSLNQFAAGANLSTRRSTQPGGRLNPGECSVWVDSFPAWVDSTYSL